MQTRYIPIPPLALGGCSIGPRSAPLNAEQAAALAQRLANEQAKTLYNCQPFRNGRPAQLVGGHWVWRDFRAQGSGDIEATVEFAADGAKPRVNVVWLDSGSIAPESLRR